MAVPLIFIPEPSKGSDQSVKVRFLTQLCATVCDTMRGINRELSWKYGNRISVDDEEKFAHPHPKPHRQQFFSRNLANEPATAGQMLKK
jgi:hypothetical protein